MLQQDPASAEARARVAQAIRQVALGRMVVADDAGRENEGDLIGPADLMAELVHDHGPMLRGAELTGFAARHGLAFVTVAELIVWRQRQSEDAGTAALVHIA